MASTEKGFPYGKGHHKMRAGAEDTLREAARPRVAVDGRYQQLGSWVRFEMFCLAQGFWCQCEAEWILEGEKHPSPGRLQGSNREPLLFVYFFCPVMAYSMNNTENWRY